ncbi:MAG: prepilin peptidase [Endozoicomonas sp.]
MLVLEQLQYSTPALLLVLVVFGLIIGSFLNVVVHRLPVMLERQWKLECLEALHPDKVPQEQVPYNLVKPGSSCPSCGHKIRPWENIPVISYLLLKGKCSSCKASISARYPLVEIISAFLAAIAGIVYGPSVEMLLVCLLSWSLLVLTLIDLDTQLLPDNITLPLVWIGLLVNISGTLVPLSDAVLGAISGYMILWSIFWLFKLATGKEGMGYGDFKLLAALGAWLGWQMLPLIIVLSSLVGTLAALALMVFKGHERSKPIPFGPYLAVAGYIALLWGEQIIDTYLRFAQF